VRASFFFFFRPLRAFAFLFVVSDFENSHSSIDEPWGDNMVASSLQSLPFLSAPSSSSAMNGTNVPPTEQQLQGFLGANSNPFLGTVSHSKSHDADDRHHSPPTSSNFSGTIIGEHPRAGSLGGHGRNRNNSPFHKNERNASTNAPNHHQQHRGHNNGGGHRRQPNRSHQQNDTTLIRPPSKLAPPPGFHSTVHAAAAASSTIPSAEPPATPVAISSPIAASPQSDPVVGALPRVDTTGTQFAVASSWPQNHKRSHSISDAADEVVLHPQSSGANGTVSRWHRLEGTHVKVRLFVGRAD
jgi:hypothetical protein